ncbi:MAG TPA: cupredoxin family copper-binding protein [Dehalococcoidia bacterium]|nr:cupredoxin family copper-binding protein [Dehalococcoidia bacterium]
MRAQRFSLTSPAVIFVGVLAGTVVLGWLAMMAWMVAAHGIGMGMHGGRSTVNDPAVVATGREVTVEMRDFAFQPGNLEAPLGATVTWVNRDAAPHDATADDGSWKTERLDRGERGSVTFDRPGEYFYYCSIHPSMQARLIIRAD